MPVAALTANRKIDLLEEQARRLHSKFVAVYDEAAAKQFKIAVADTDIRVGSGMDGLIDAACMDGTDCVVTAVSGSVGLRPTLAAIDAKKPASLSEKVIETVIRGEIGFDGFLICDDLSMKALSGGFADLTKQAIAAGCDAVLHCNGDMKEMKK